MTTSPTIKLAASPISAEHGASTLAPTAEPRPLAKPKPAKGGWWWGTGRRKRAVARVRIRPAKEGGVFKICLAGEKTKTPEVYFAEDRDRGDVVAPLKITGTAGKLDVFVRVNGGGYMGQAGAIKMGLARALAGYDPALEIALRDNGMLTRDAREVERKKYGQAGARRRFQFSKR
ncbi:MAG: 30S ribosomal protein S9 [Phycisphaerales bacterium]